MYYFLSIKIKIPDYCFGNSKDILEYNKGLFIYCSDNLKNIETIRDILCLNFLESLSNYEFERDENWDLENKNKYQFPIDIFDWNQCGCYEQITYSDLFDDTFKKYSYEIKKYNIDEDFPSIDTFIESYTFIENFIENKIYYYPDCTSTTDSNLKKHFDIKNEYIFNFDDFCHLLNDTENVRCNIRNLHV